MGKRMRKQAVDFIQERDFQPLIKVTKDVLHGAIVRDSSHCVIADAIKKRLPKARRVSVDLQTIRLSIGDKRYIYLTPRSAQQLLVDFDQGKPIGANVFPLAECANPARNTSKWKGKSQKGRCFGDPEGKGCRQSESWQETTVTQNRRQGASQAAYAASYLRHPSAGSVGIIPCYFKSNR